MAKSFELIEIGMRDIAIANAQEFFQLGYRRTVPVILLCRLPTLKHTSAIRCAPVDHYFRAITDYPVFSSSLYSHTSAHLIPSDSFYEGFLEEIQSAGVNKKALPRALFAPYAQWGAYGERMRPALGGEFAGAALDGRAASAFVPDELVERLIRHWERQFEQFDFRALQPAPEALNDIVGNPRFDLVPGRSGVTYQSPDYEAFAANTFVSERAEENASIRLKQLVAELESGQPAAPELFPLHTVKLVPSIFLKTSHPYPSPPWERAQLRARLIRSLGYVWHYPAVLGMFEDLKNKPLRAGDKRDLALDQIRSDLGAYLADMRRAYPVIEEDPFTSQESPSATA